ncbi:hypothetical protein [Cytobacillus sp. IB215665]|uniref:hypothetical protein n=1 Tax=Cytobacillus sp. IB215665 TaxID=3097357 RepID=UPI002A116201|nr:hypothetical protein [Cytobacillus sp. IB215665]MDX8366034.1 hypothetical protein [Cytobacillus sp. IB215665]
MKRFGKTILLCIVTVIIIGTFYMQSSIAATENKLLVWKKVSGNEDTVKNIEILAAGYTIETREHHNLQITNKNTINRNNTPSLLEQLSESWIHPIILEWREQYNNFMRGKNSINLNHYYEDDNVLVYVGDIWDYQSRSNISFNIDILNKKSEEVSSIQLKLPNKESYDFLDVREIQVLNGIAKVFASGQRKDGGEDLTVYTFDIDEQEFMNSELLLSTPIIPSTITNFYATITMMNDLKSVEPQKYLLMKADATIYSENGETVQYDDGSGSDPNELVIYNIETNQSKSLTIPDEMLISSNSSTIVGSTLFFTSQQEDEFGVIMYDIEKEEWGDKITFDFLNEQTGYDIKYQLINGKINILHSTTNGYALYVSDLSSGELLYEGKLTSEKYDQLGIQSLS